MATILVIDDEPVVCDHVAGILEKAGHTVLGAQSAEAAFHILDLIHPDVILLDLLMPLVDGNSFLEQLRSRPERPPVVLLSAAVDRLRKDLKAEIRAAVEKPVNEADLLAAVKKATEAQT